MSGHEPVRDQAIPILASLDLDETASFYGKLGFRTVVYPDIYLIAMRDSLEVHFWACQERHIAENTSCYFRVGDVDAFHSAFAGLDLAPGRMDEPADMPWGMREFHIWDPHGNLIRVGQIIDGGSGE